MLPRITLPIICKHFRYTGEYGCAIHEKCAHTANWTACPDFVRGRHVTKAVALPDADCKCGQPVAKELAPDGVLTASNSVYWPTLSALVEACNEQGVPVAVADHGLTADHRKRLESHGVIMLDGTLNDGILAVGRRDNKPIAPAEAWLKPWVCAASPFRNTVWIDADAVPVGNLDELLAFTRAHDFWMTRNHWNNGYGGNAGMYQSLAKGTNPERYAIACNINTGVFGFRRTTKVLGLWQRSILDMLRSDLALRSMTRDQAALILGLSKGSTPIPVMLWDERYNLAANRLSANDRAKRKRYRELEGTAMLAELRRDHPGASVVHFLGRPKPWDN